jgi:hypothetical protein
MKLIKKIVREIVVINYFIVLASFWAFIVCAGFVVSTIMPIISIIQIFDVSTPDSTYNQGNYKSSYGDYYQQTET